MSHAGKLVIISAFVTQLAVLAFGVMALGAIPPMAATAGLFAGFILSTALTMLAGHYRSQALRQAGLGVHFAVSFGWSAWAVSTAGVVVSWAFFLALFTCVTAGALCTQIGLERDLQQAGKARRLDDLQTRARKALQNQRLLTAAPPRMARPTLPYESGAFSAL